MHKSILHIFALSFLFASCSPRSQVEELSTDKVHPGAHRSSADRYYQGTELPVFVKPSEPTQLNFPSDVQGGFKRKNSSLVLERRENHLVIFPQPTLTASGEAIIVRLIDARSFSIRVLPATDENPREAYLTIDGDHSPISSGTNSAASNAIAPPSQVSGLIREMILAAEFGKATIPGYRQSNAYIGQTIYKDGILQGTVEKIFMGNALWGYIIQVENLTSEPQKVDPSLFRLDGTRAIRVQKEELTPNKGADAGSRSFVYIVTRAKSPDRRAVEQSNPPDLQATGGSGN